MARQRKKYTEEFKRDAVRLMRNRGERTVAQVADDLGVPTNQLHRWAAKLEKLDVAKRNDRGETLEEENRRLRKDVERLRMEKPILKKAAAKSICQGNILIKLSAGERKFSVLRGRALSSLAISSRSRCE